MASAAAAMYVNLPTSVIMTIVRGKNDLLDAYRQLRETVIW